jgi:hypothetical protein
MQAPFEVSISAAPVNSSKTLFFDLFKHALHKATKQQINLVYFRVQLGDPIWLYNLCCKASENPEDANKLQRRTMWELSSRTGARFGR